MGSVKLKDLKAFVRYDGSGRVVSGSLVFRKKKPKNGRWGEITKNLCCTDSGTTTTTTTSVTPTAFTREYWTNTFNACTTTTSGDVTFYSASSVLIAGVTVYVNAALTIPLYEGWVIYEGGTMTSYVVGAGGVLSVLNCSSLTTTTTAAPAPTLYVSGTGPNACSGNGSPITNYTFTGGTTICDSTMITSNDFMSFSPGTQYISDGVNTVAVNIPGFGAPFAYPDGECVSC